MARNSLGTAWLSGCAGCHMAILNEGERLLRFLENHPIKYSPLTDTGSVPKVHAFLVEGAVATEHDRAFLSEVREKSKVLVAFGTCAVFGGIPGLRNLSGVAEVLQASYGDKTPKGAPRLLDDVRCLAAHTKVDISVPGCPPPPNLIAELFAALDEGRLPDFPKRNLCLECSRERPSILVPKQQFLSDSIYAPKELQKLVGSAFLLPRRIHVDTVYALCELDEIDPGLCFLEQGVLCLGPATRRGCKARCLAANVPCRGCMGPPPRVTEQGAKMIDALAAILPPGALMLREDIVGAGYRYSLPCSEGGRRRGGRRG